MKLNEIYTPGQKRLVKTPPDKLVQKIIEKEMTGKISSASLTTTKAQLRS